MKRHLTTILLLFLDILLLSAAADITEERRGRTRINTLPIGDNLPHSDVNAIVQDEIGYMWFATYGGLCKYDGNRVMTYRTHNSGISNDRVISLYAAKDSLIYAGTESSGLNVYNPKTDRFYPIRDFEGNPPTADDVVFSIFEDADGEIWACHNNCLSKIIGDVSDKRVQTCYRTGSGKDIIHAGISLSPDSLLISTLSDLRIYEKSTGKCTRFISNIHNVYSFAKKDDGTILIGASNGIYALSDGKISKFTDCAAVRSLYIADNNHIYAGTYENGLIEYSSNGKQLSHYAPEKINSLEISALYEDSSGLLWVGTIGGGLNTLTLQSNNIDCYTTSEGLSQNRVLGFTEDFGEFLWISSHNGGIDVLNTADGKFYNLKINGRPSSDFFVISSFYNDRYENIWLSTWVGGAYLVSREDIQGIHESIRKGNTGSLSINARRTALTGEISVFKITEDKEGHFWFSTDKGLYEYDGREIYSYRHDSMNLSSLYSDYLTDIYVDTCSENKVIWIGTRAGLNKLVFDETGNPTMHRVSFPEQGNKSVFISVIHRDLQSRLWIATIGDGLYHLKNEDTPTFINYNQGNSYLPNNDLESLLEDSDGNLWIGGGSGIWKFNPNEKTLKAYTAKDNLQSNSFKIWSAYKTRDGRMVFGGTKGFNIFRPDRIAVNENTPNTVISNALTKTGKLSDGDILKHDENSVTFEFAALSFNNSVYNQYRYRLKGSEKDFNYTTGLNPKAVYSNLMKGQYCFEVYGSNSDEVWNETPATLTFKVKAHPLLSTVAYILYIMAFLTAIYVSYRLSMKRIHEKNRVKIQEEKLQYFTDMAHEIKTPLSLISAPVEELLNNPHLGISTRERLTIINKSVSTLRSVVEQILDLRKYEDNMMKLSVSEIDLCHFLQEIGDLFVPLAMNRNISFKIDIPENAPIKVYCERHKIERVVVNLLSNAFKFTEKEGTVILKCRAEEKYACFSVEDNGTGISEKDLAHIFDRFYQGRNQNEGSRSGSGIGLALSQYIVNHHKGRITVDSRLGFGSKFTVYLPLGSSHFKEEQINSEYKNSNDLSNYEPVSNEGPVGLQDKDITILVVDDNDSLRNYLAALLMKQYNVLLAKNGMEAYEIAIAEQPDMILSDIVMPEMGGIELCRRIKNNDATSHITVILLTARDLALTEIDSWQAGADGFLAKPFSVGVLTSRIENMVSRKEKMRKAFQTTLEVKPSEITVMTSDEKLMKRCLEAIEQNMEDSGFGVEELSTAVGVSKAQLYRKINAATGLTTIQFIRKLRLKRAAQILSQDSSSVNEVMYKVGFNNLSYFSKIFKEEFGCSPKDYVKK